MTLALQLCLVSLLFYVFELLLIQIVKRQIKTLFNAGIEIEHIYLREVIGALDRLNINHLGIFSVIYFLLLLVGKRYLVILGMVLVYQVLSVSLDLFMIWKISRLNKTDKKS
jgi:hypothetical protein